MKKIIQKKGEGRTYNCGSMTAIFKSDEEETNSSYSISEWWLKPMSDGPGAHSHEENDEVFYVISGQVEILAGENWNVLHHGDFMRIPANTIHDFRNRSNEKAGILNFFIPGGFERNMPAIVKWFENNPEKQLSI